MGTEGDRMRKSRMELHTPMDLREIQDWIVRPQLQRVKEFRSQYWWF